MCGESSLKPKARAGKSLTWAGPYLQCGDWRNRSHEHSQISLGPNWSVSMHNGKWGRGKADEVSELAREWRRREKNQVKSWWGEGESEMRAIDINSDCAECVVWTCSHCSMQASQIGVMLTVWRNLETHIQSEDSEVLSHRCGCRSQLIPAHQGHSTQAMMQLATAYGPMFSAGPFYMALIHLLCTCRHARASNEHY